MSKGYSSLFQACEPATGNTLEPTDDDTRGTSKQPLSTTADELSQVALPLGLLKWNFYARMLITMPNQQSQSKQSQRLWGSLTAE